MDQLKPADEIKGASPWSKEQMAESPTLLPSLKFHDLVFGHELGKGAFGTVTYSRLIDRNVTRSHWPEYAVKIISTQKIQEMGYEQSVQREIAILRVLSHPGIARLISSFRFRDGAYLVLEYASRGDLHSVLQKSGSLDDPSTQFVMGEVVAALSSIHELGFVYGDLKPENILITETGHIKLTDFGGSRPFTSEAEQLIKNSTRNLLKNLRDGDWKSRHPDTDETTGEETGSSNWGDVAESDRAEKNNEEDHRVEGTTAYLPPEVVMGAIPTPGADSWALGCVLYQCLSGRPPMIEDDEEATRRKIVKFNGGAQEAQDTLFGHAHGKDISQPARNLIHRLLSRNPLERPNLASVAEDDFFEGKDVFALYKHDAYPLDVGTVAPTADARWARRQFSSIWAPQPKAYDISMPEEDEDNLGTPQYPGTAPFVEGEERAAFFSLSAPAAGGAPDVPLSPRSTRKSLSKLFTKEK
jgi:serine/threonine protein kinase